MPSTLSSVRGMRSVPPQSLPLEGCTPNAQVQDRQMDYSEDWGYLTMKPLRP